MSFSRLTLRFKSLGVLIGLFIGWNGLGEPLLQFQSEGMYLTVEEVLSKQGSIWGMDFISKNLLIFTEKSGAIKTFNLQTKKLIPIIGVPRVAALGQGGLLDIHLHPNFHKNKWVYLTYSVAIKDQYTTRLSRARLDKNRLTHFQILLTAQALSRDLRHFGSRIAFDGNGHLYFSVGDRGEREEAQNLRNHKGSVLRLTEDGHIPADNPFLKNKLAKKEIWSYGHRNPQGLVFDSRTQRLWLGEHGPYGGDEINLVKKGANYGWPKASYGAEYFPPHKRIGKKRVANTLQPTKYYVPSIAPCGMILYTGHIYPQWQNNIFMGSLALRHLNRIVLNKKGTFFKEERLLQELNERIRNVKQSPEGLLYLSTDSGRILRIQHIQ